MEGFIPWPDEFAKLYKEKGYWEDKTFGEHLAQWVEAYGDRPALAYRGQDISYNQMDEYATRLAYHMARLGMKTYDPVVMQLPNIPELVYMVYACLKIGAIPICSLPNHRWSEISFLAKETEARAHVIPASAKDFDYEGLALEVREAAPSVKYVFTAGETNRSGMISINDLLERGVDLKEARREIARYRPDPMLPALFQLSGGTTGVPKIIPRIHNDYYYNALRAAVALEFDGNTRCVLALPLMHNFPLVNGLFAIHDRGGVAVLVESLAPEALLQAISENKADGLMTVPVLMHRLLEIPDDVLEKYNLTSFKHLYWGGNAVPPDIQMKFRQVFHCDSDQTYGMAEGLINWTRPSDPLDVKLNTQGSPVSEADEVKVVDINSGEEMPLGTVGECWTRGPYTLRGYYKAYDHNKIVFSPDGFYKTGDLIKKDERGNLTIVGRIKDCISRGAEKINAEEIEAHIVKFPKAKNAAVVAMPDPVMGERVCAFVVPQAGETFALQELNNFLLNEQKIAKFKVPERLEFIDELPITKVGKFEKKSLREKIEEILKSEGKI
jgi:2,3-dihydroxybenzoate-AMP ligase